MRLSSEKILKYVSAKASDGDERAKITYEYLKLLFKQWEKQEAINHKLDYIERCERNIREIHFRARNHTFGEYTESDKRILSHYENALAQTKEQLAKMQAEYDAEYGA